MTVWYDVTGISYPAKSPSTYHQIDYKYFKGRTYQGANGAESMRLGDSNSSRTDGYNIVEYNLYENMTQNEPEIISNKSNFNTYRYNTIKNSAGGLTLRHGRYSDVYAYEVNGSGSMVGAGIGGVVPVQLVSFSVSVVNKVNNLKWHVENEVNFKQYEV